MKQNLLFNQASALGKRLAMVLTMLLTIGIETMWGAEATATLSFASTAQRDSQTTTKQVWSNDGITFTNNKGSSTTNVGNYSNPVRLYASSEVIVEHTSDKITQIVFVANSNAYATAMKNSIGTVSDATVSVSGSKVTVTFTNSVESFTVAKLTAQVRLTSLTVTYEEEVTCTEITPSLTYSSTTLEIGSTANPTLTDNTGDGTVTYLSDNSSVASVNATTGVVTAKAAGTATITASIAANGSYCEGSATATITVNKQSATIVLSEAGTENTVSGTFYKDDSYTLPSSTDAKCGDKVLVGWSTIEIAETDTKPTSNYYDKGTSVSLKAGENKFYAVFATESETTGGTTTTPTTATLSFASKDQRTTLTTSQQVWTQNGITLTNDKGSSTSNVADYSNPARFYKSSNIRVEAPGNITKIVFKCVKDYVISITGATTSGYNVTVSLDGTSGTYTVNTLSAQVRMNSLEVTYNKTTTGGTTITYSDYTTSCTTETVVTLNPNGGTISNTDGWTENGNGTYSKTHEGTEIALPTATKTNYIFGGWYKGETKYETIPADLTESITLTAKWLDKQDAGIYWDPESVTVTIDADGNILPEFNNPNEIDGIEFSSSNPSVVAVDANGVITLGSTGTTATVTITATFNGDETYAAKTVTCSITVHPSNCKWVEVTDNTTLEYGDEVVITMTKSNITHALPNAKRVTTDAAPTAIDVTKNIDGKEMISVANNLKWFVEIVDGYYVFYTITNEERLNLYCNSTDNAVCVASTGNALTNHKFSVESNYLKSQAQPRYLAISYSTNSWRSPADNTTATYSGQTLKFYKRECLDSEHYWVTWDAGEGTWEDKSSKKLESYQVGDPITKPTESPTREGYRFDGWTPAPTTMPAENITFTAKWTEVYTITWYENGVPSYTYVPSDNPVVTWEDDIADCGTKKFYGWTADDTFVSDPTTPPTLISKGTTIAGDVIYYAVYADAEEPANSGGYTKVTTISEGTYLIAAPSKNIAYKAVTSNVSAVISNNVISSLPEGATELLVELGTNTNAGYFAISYNNNGTKTYIYGADKSLNTMNTATYDWSLDADNATLGEIQSKSKPGYYIQANNNNSDFKAYAHTQTVAYLYKKQTTTYKNFAVSCATYDILVTTPTGGTVTTTPAYEAGAGQTITVNVTPAECKYLTALKYNKYNDGSDYSINIYSTPYTFTMPAADVTVTATFADKTATDIEILTSAHRNLMQGSAFVGEQIKVTYDNGETETLDWEDTRLTFSGYNMATLGTYTVRVDYNDCGTANTSYSIEVIDGIAITFIDAGISETIKYELNAHVDVETKTGQYACSGHEFVGWSEIEFPLSDVPNMRTSEEYVPVRNFNATTSRTLYAVYSILKKQGWVSIEDANHIRSGAEYMIVKNRYDTYSALSTTTSTYNANYRAATILDKDEDDNTGNMIVWRRTSDNTDFQIYTGTATNDVKWLLIKKDNKNYLYNQTEKKYLQVTTTAITLTSEMADNFKITDESGDCCLNIQSATSNYYISGYNSSNNYYFQPYSTETDANYLLTRDSLFTTTPPCFPLYAIFHGNGGIVTDGESSLEDLPITEPTRDAGITTPTASFADCNGKSWTFVGWSREEIDVTRVPVLTTDLLHDGGGNKHYNIEKNGEEFWAVYTNIGNPETKYGTITFTDADVTKQYENAKTITKSVTAMGDYDFELYHVSDASSLGIQFDHNSTPKGYIKNITSLGKINSISLNDFQVGDIDDVKVYVGNTSDAINILLTEADLQQTGNTYTYYPPKNYAYVKIEANGYCGITSISIDFGKGTQIWATTPDCSVLTLSGDEVYVTSTNGQSIRAAAQLTVRARQLPTNLVLTSNNSDVYFSTEKDANFTKAVAKQPKQLLTLDVDGDGNLDNTTIYVHYKPSVDGTGIPEDVVVSANLETPNPSITDDHTIHVRNLPATFAIVAKVGNVWYALPSQGLNSTTPPAAYPVEVDNMADPTAVTSVPANADWSLRQVYTSSGSDDRFADYGDNLVFVNNASPAMTLNASSSGNYLLTDAQYANYYSTNPGLYEWTPTTTDLETYQLTNEQRSRTLSVNTATVFGVHAQDKAVEQVRFLPIQNRYTPAALQVVEWKENSVVIMYNGDPAQTASVSVNGAAAQNTTLSAAQRDIAVYELAANGLAANPTQRLSITIGTEKVILSIPYIISGAQTDYDLLPGSSVSAKREAAKIADLIVLNAATLTAAGVQSDPYKFRHVTIYGGGKLVIPSDKGFGVASLTLRAGGVTDAGEYDYVYPQFELRGTFTNSAAKINYDYITDYDHWYHLVLPFAGDLGTIKYPTEFYGANVAANNTGSWQIKRYAGEIRATGNYDAWKDIETEGATSTTAGQGYIFWGAPKKVSVNGGDTQRQKWGIQRITMSVTGPNVMTAENGDKAISELSSYATVEGNSGKDNDQGWNLIGNPYMVNLTDMATTGLHACKLVEVIDPATGKWNGKWEWNDETNIRYLTIPSEHFDTYTAKTVNQAVPLVAGRAFFVQLEGEANAITFAAANRASLMPALRAANDKPVDIETGIILSNEILQDEVNFWIKDGKTNDYEYNADYPKTPNNNQFNIYGVHTNGDLSWVATGPEYAAESMPIGYQVPAAGTYMLSLSEIYNSDGLDALYVTDHALSPEVTVDIMSEPYEFSVNQAETNNERFTVSVRVKAKTENGATGLGNVGAESEQIHKFIYQDKMYILHHGVIYDATGKRVITINK